MRRVFRFVRIKEFIDASKELYTGTPNSDIRILCTVLCGRNVNKPRAPTEVEGKGLQLRCDITVQQKTSKSSS